MTKVSELVFSNHCLQERLDRINLIEEKVGYGQIIKESYWRGSYHFLTDTGVAFVVDNDKHYIITLYLVDEGQANRLYGGKIPKSLQRKISKNISMGYVKLRD